MGRIEREAAGGRGSAAPRRKRAACPIAEHVSRAHVFFEGELQQVGGLWNSGYRARRGDRRRRSRDGQRINMVTAIRRTLDQELEANPRVLLFGEDIGPKGGVHAVTLGLQEKYRPRPRVRHQPLNEEGIVGRAVGMALAGLMPVPEIQFRKYAEPATEQINDCGTMRWRTDNRFAAPMVLRVPGGFFKCGDPWHSQTNEVAVRPQSRAGRSRCRPTPRMRSACCVGACAATIRCIFFEHRAMLDDGWARRPWPGDDYVLPFGRAKKTREGDRHHHRHLGRDGAALRGGGGRRLGRRDRPAHADAVGRGDGARQSVRRTRRCLIVHEDLRTGGFGAEIAAVVADEAFLDLDAPVARLTMPDIPSPHHPELLDWAVPSVERIRAEIDDWWGSDAVIDVRRSRRAGRHQGGRPRLAEAVGDAVAEQRSAGRTRDRQGDAGGARARCRRSCRNPARQRRRGGAGRVARAHRAKRLVRESGGERASPAFDRTVCAPAFATRCW